MGRRWLAPLPRQQYSRKFKRQSGNKFRLCTSEKSTVYQNQLLTFGVSSVMSTHGHWMHRRSVVDLRQTVPFFRRLVTVPPQKVRNLNVPLTRSLRTGRRMLQVATLEVTSVAKEVPMMTIRTRTRLSRKSRTASCDPSQADSPETCVALARANPPPRRSTSDQGIRSWITCHRSSPGEGAEARSSAMEERGLRQRFFFCQLERIALENSTYCYVMTLMTPGNL